MSAATFCSIRAWVGGLLHQVRRVVDRGDYIAQACTTFLMSDETTLPSGKHRWQAKVADPHTAAEDGPLHMVQSEVVLGMLLTRSSTGKACFWTVPVPTPLQCVDHCTGETLHALWSALTDIPQWAEVQRLFNHRFHCRIMDRAGSNIRAHRLEEQAHPEDMHLWMSCDSHLVSTVTGRSYAPVDSMITGAE